jgi:hypothetical protein
LGRQKPLVTELNRPLSLVPKVATAVTITTATSEAIKAYSIAVTPRRSRKNSKDVRLGGARCKTNFLWIGPGFTCRRRDRNEPKISSVELSATL